MIGGLETQAAGSAWSRLLAGVDEHAFTEVFNRHHKSVYNFCFRRLGNWVSAEDATQATFAALWRRVREGRIETPRSGDELAVLLGMARHECLSRGRARQRRGRLVERIGQQPLPPVEADQDRWIEAQDMMAAIDAALAILNRGQRDVIELACWAGLGIEQTAEALGIAPGTVKSRLSRARAKLAASDLSDLLAGA